MNPILYGLIVTLFGMIIVFLVLIGLWGILAMMRPFFGEKKKNNQEVTESKLSPAVTEITAASTEYDDVDSDELIAVLTAAVQACMGSQSNLVVRRITRVADNTPVWGQIARHEQMLNRL